ncbi:MAG: hypothetical protein ACHQAW_02370 [Actinomycetota bacterium]|jgi:hypothetical protein
MASSGRREPFTIRLRRNRAARSFFLGLATLAAALGFPIRVEPPPRRTSIEVVRDEEHEHDETEPPTAVR